MSQHTEKREMIAMVKIRFGNHQNLICLRTCMAFGLPSKSRPTCSNSTSKPHLVDDLFSYIKKQWWWKVSFFGKGKLPNDMSFWLVCWKWGLLLTYLKIVNLCYASVQNFTILGLESQFSKNCFLITDIHTSKISQIFNQ